MQSLCAITCLLVIATTLALTPTAAGSSGDPENRLGKLMLEAKTLSQQAALLLQLGYLQHDDAEVAALARDRLPLYGGLVIRPLAEALEEPLSLETHRALVRLAGLIYLSIKGTSPQYLTVIRNALESDDPEIRREALSQVGRYRVQHLALAAADVYFRNPPDRAQVLEVLGELKDRRGIAPALHALDSDDLALRDLAIRTLARIGRPAAIHLKERMLGDDPARARDAARALLGFADQDDLSTLYEYAGRYAAQDEELGQKLTRVIAEIEVGEYVPPDPADL